MHVSINERQLAPLAPQAGVTVGELVDALGVHIDPHDILTAVTLDGVCYSAGEPESYGRRAAGSVQRLELTTQPPRVFAAAKRRDLGEVLGVLAGQVREVATLFRAGAEGEANRVLAALMEELRLALLLDRQLVMLDGGPPVIPHGDIETLGPALLEAETTRAWRALADLLLSGLVPVLEAAAAGHGGGADPAGGRAADGDDVGGPGPTR